MIPKDAFCHFRYFLNDGIEPWLNMWTLHVIGQTVTWAGATAALPPSWLQMTSPAQNGSILCKWSHVIHRPLLTLILTPRCTKCCFRMCTCVCFLYKGAIFGFLTLPQDVGTLWLTGNNLYLLSQPVWQINQSVPSLPLSIPPLLHHKEELPLNGCKLQFLQHRWGYRTGQLSWD